MNVFMAYLLYEYDHRPWSSKGCLEGYYRPISRKEFQLVKDFFYKKKPQLLKNKSQIKNYCNTHRNQHMNLT